MTIARTWLGTPYHHQASVKGVGCDCLGLVRGVYAELYGREPEAPPPYTRDLAEATGCETLLEAARRHLVETDPFENTRVGDVIVFRIRRQAMAKHCGIVTLCTGMGRPERMIHAFEGGPVCEINLNRWWRRKIVATFIFPKAHKWR